MHEEYRNGIDYLEDVTALMQRVRCAHPTFGSYEAAELQWWWTIPRSTDTFPQLFWFDDSGQAEAAVIATDFGDGSSALYADPTLVVLVLPDTSPEKVEYVVRRGLAHAAEHGMTTVELEVGSTDDAMRDILFGHGFAKKGEGLVECWLDADARPEISSLHEGYRLLSRSETAQRPHHMTHPRRPDIEKRLQQTSLYRSDLDLVVVDRDDHPAAYGLFWYDPVSRTGVVEPMRTQDDHQRRGLGRHILTTGVELLAQAGAGRISITYGPDNPASGPLYRSLGFVPHRQTALFSGRVDTRGPSSV